MPKRSTSRKNKPIHNLVVVSDTHCGDGLALCPPEVRLDDGGTYKQSKLQRVLWAWWKEFWDEFVPTATHGEPFSVVHNGDAIDGVHHNSTNQITHNLATQRGIAQTILEPVVEAAEGRYYHIRGTEAHVGKSAESEEELARNLGAIPNDDGQFSRYELRKIVGNGLVHCLHHVGTTGSNAYEATAVHKELVETYTEAARWGTRPPDIIVRSHRHRHIETSIPNRRLVNGAWVHGKARAVVTPAWQSKTPFAWKIPGARLSTPQFGGIVICYAPSTDVLFIKEFVRSPEPPAPE